MFTSNPWNELRRIQREMDNLFSSSDPFGNTWGGSCQKAIGDTTSSGDKQLSATGGGPSSSVLSLWHPSTDLKETDTHYELRAELPGLSKDDVCIDFEDGAITISGEKKFIREDSSEKKGAEGATSTDQSKKQFEPKYHWKECSYGRFERRLPLPRGVNSKDIKASFENGVLKVDIPKPQQSPQQKINISA